nr:nudix hydrolase 1-like [Ipomoea batatas]
MVVSTMDWRVSLRYVLPERTAKPLKNWSSDNVPQSSSGSVITEREKVFGRKAASPVLGTSCFSVPSGHLWNWGGFEECAAREVKKSRVRAEETLQTSEGHETIYFTRTKPSHYYTVIRAN